MIKNILIYLSTIIATIVCLFIYSGDFIGVLLVTEIVYLIWAIIQVIKLKKSLFVELDCNSPIAEKGKNVKVFLKVKSKHEWIFGNYIAKISIMNRLEGKKIKKTFRGMSLEDSKIEYIFVPKRCGKYEIRIDSLYVTDMLGIIKIKKKINQHLDVGVLPETNLIPLEVTRQTREFNAEAEEGSSRESGDDPSELYQIREYKNGDSLHDIHWKLSAKEDEFQVKERGKPLGASVLIKLNFKDKKIQHNKINESAKAILKNTKAGTITRNNIEDDALNIMSAIVFSLFDAECIGMVAWYDSEAAKIEKMRILKEEDIYILLNKSLYLHTYQDSEYVEVAFNDALRGIQFSTVIDVYIDGTVKVNKEPVEIPKTKGGKGNNKETIAWDRFVISV